MPKKKTSKKQLVEERTTFRCHLDTIFKVKMLADKPSKKFISKHFELENGVNLTPKRRHFLPALFFTCFCITKPLLIKTYVARRIW